MSVCRRSGCGACFYCDALVSRHEHDHAPTPQRCGGVETVVACMMCHGLKDRHTMERWPLTLLVMAAAELANHGIAFDGTQDRWPDCWDDLTAHARVLWAKCAAVSMDRAQLEAAGPGVDAA